VRALVVDRDPTFAEALRGLLERRKFAVQIASDGEAGNAALIENHFHVAIVDIDLPRRDGFSVVREARAAGIEIPMLILTARDAVEDRVRGLDAGADDYMIRPFQEEELHARLRALLRRAPMPLRERRTVGNLVLDSGARTVAVDDQPIELASTEFRLLEYFASNPGIVLSRDQILDCVWGTSFGGSRNIVEVYVCSLRRKLRPVNSRARLATVWGVGYKLIA
jgi:DNA-binding response OmpR family regulator